MKRNKKAQVIAGIKKTLEITEMFQDVVYRFLYKNKLAILSRFVLAPIYFLEDCFLKIWHHLEN